MQARKPSLGLAPALPAVTLVIVIIWALAAVLMLTGTLVNAREIDNTLPLIKAQVLPIDENTDNVELAEETAQLTEQIRDAAAPLSDQADRIIGEARSIDRSAAAILVTARAINGTAESINGNALAINDTVGEINGNVVSINGTVNSIEGNVLSINRTANSIEGNVLSINRTANSIEGNVLSINSRVSSVGADVASINGRVESIFDTVGPEGATDGDSIKAAVDSILDMFRELDPVTRSIDTGVADINRRANAGIERVGLLKSDFTPIRVLVGPSTLGPAGNTTDGPGAIHGHANSIDCSNLLNLIGSTDYCGE